MINDFISLSMHDGYSFNYRYSDCLNNLEKHQLLTAAYNRVFKIKELLAILKYLCTSLKEKNDCCLKETGSRPNSTYNGIL